MRLALNVLATNASTMERISFKDNSWGTCQPSPNGRGEGATVGHGDWSGLRYSRPSHGTCDEALRPAWAIWMPIGDFDTRLQASITFLMEASLCSLYRPVQPCVMRPSRVTCVASTIRSPAPEYARCPRCTKCQS